MSRTSEIGKGVDVKLDFKTQRLLNQMVYFDQVLHANACQQYLATGMCNIIFEWARDCSASFQLVVVTGMQHGDKGLPSII